MKDDIGAPAETHAKPSEPNASRETSTPPQRNKPSSFYVYLLILFGAAFLMLLLAYFVQRRNNDTALSDLRSTTAATRQELLDDIQRLEEENLALRQDKEALDEQMTDLQRQLDELETDSFWREKNLFIQLASWHDFWDLEQNFYLKDYEACAQFFRQIHGSNYYATPAEAAERAEEIYNLLLEQGFLTEDVPLPVVYTAE